MKKLLVILISITMIACSGVHAQLYVENVTFEWDANPETNLVEYRLYNSIQSNQYDYTAGPVDTIPAGTETTLIEYSFEGPALPITYYWVLTAVNEDGLESGPSNQVQYTFTTPDPLIPPRPPENFKKV